nr:hypothetical protein [Tanacetum cinerariifolium]
MHKSTEANSSLLRPHLHINLKLCQEALKMLQGTHFGAHTVRLLGGRSSASKQALQSQYNGGYYGYRQGHETYECAQVPRDPGLMGILLHDLRMKTGYH